MSRERIASTTLHVGQRWDRQREEVTEFPPRRRGDPLPPLSPPDVCTCTPYPAAIFENGTLVRVETRHRRDVGCGHLTTHTSAQDFRGTPIARWT